MSAVVELLAQSPLFTHLSRTNCEQIAARLTRLELAADAEIVRQGDAGDALYLIESGCVGVFVRDEKIGLVRMLNVLGPRESFGEMALVTSTPRNATCIALERTVVHRLTREVFEAVASKAPQVALAIARVLAERMAKLASEREVPWMSLAGRRPDRRLMAAAPEPLMRSFRAVPVEMDKHFVTLGMVDPQDGTAIQLFSRAFSSTRLRVVAISADEFERFMNMLGSGGAVAEVQLRTGEGVSVSADARPTITFIEDETASPAKNSVQAMTGPQVVAMVDEIIGTALAIGASDIHIEHERKSIAVRYRVDGALRARAQPLGPELGKPLVSRLKLLAKVDITETRRPQDGRISLTAGKRNVDLRLSTMPAKFGEKIVMRILDAEANIADLKALLVYEPVRQMFAEMASRPHGLLLVTGPTGSGKSTTMYSALCTRRRPETNIVTVEDPIEYHLDGVTQVQVQREVTSFASILRALLRQDPNVILVGETRDRETAAMAVEASTTGHMVITSMHTNSALEAMYRLLDLGIERYAISNALIGVLHQRLVRRVCQHCSEPCDYPAAIIEKLQRAKALAAGDVPALRRGAGCARCSGSGYKGRVSVTELLPACEAVRNAFSAGAALADVRPVAQYGGLIELPRCAGALLTQGITTPSEILHLVQSSSST